MMWPGAQPQKDKFNETYFQVAKQIVDRCIAGWEVGRDDIRVLLAEFLQCRAA